MGGSTHHRRAALRHGAAARVLAMAAAASLSAQLACNALLDTPDRALAPDGGVTTPDVPIVRPDGGDVLDVTRTEDAGSSDASTDAPGDAPIVYVGCLGEPACERIIFTTSDSWKGGELGGLAGADAKCQAVADRTNNDRIRHHVFRAWLSTSTEQAANRLAAGTQPYRRIDGTLVASSFADLLNTGPEAPIQNEHGVVSGKGAWTGTKNNGNRSDDTCNDWTTNASTGLTGDPDQPPTWSSDPPAVSCENTGTLICIEH